MEAIQKFVATMLSTFVDIIVGAVYDRINERVLKVENDVKELHDAGSTLLALNLDDLSFRERLKAFVDERIDYHTQAAGDKIYNHVTDRISEEIDTAIRPDGAIGQALTNLADKLSPSPDTVRQAVDARLKAVLRAGIGAVDSMGPAQTP